MKKLFIALMITSFLVKPTNAATLQDQYGKSVFHLTDEVTNKTATDFDKFVRDLQADTTAKRGLIIISSPGGSVRAEEQIIYDMEQSGKPIDVYGFGMVASAAAMIFSAGTERYMDRGQLLFHNAKASQMGDIGLPDLKELETMLLAIRAEDIQIMEMHDGLNAPQAENLFKFDKDTVLSPSEARGLNIITSLTRPMFKETFPEAQKETVTFRFPGT